MTEAAMFEPPPFGGAEESDADVARREAKRRDKPFLPYSKEEFDRVLKRPAHTRMVDPWRCAYNLDAPDGIGHGYDPDTYSRYAFRQCKRRIADPTRARYCYEHATELGVAFYSPEEASGVIHAEAQANLLRLIPKGIEAMEKVLEDPEATNVERIRAFEAVSDRTGYGKGMEININAQIEVSDPAAVLRERLSNLRDSQLEAAARMAAEAERHAIEAEVVDAEIVEDEDPEPAA